MPDSEPTLEVPSAEVHNRKKLKRSYSATSIASLPTPPRTRKRKRSGSRHSRATDSDSESDNAILAYDSDEEEILERQRKESGKETNTLVLGNKRRKILQVDAIAAELSGRAEEDAFWGVSTTDAKEKPLDSQSKAEGSSKTKSKEPARERSRSRSRSPSCSPAAHLLKRNPTGLLSPPQSHRHKSPRVLPFPIPVKATEPKTPPRKTRSGGRSIRRRLFPERDSPNNPFLDDAKEGEARVSVHDSSSPEPDSAEPHTPQPYIEKPTITYVFRGVRTEFDNPLYDPRYPETGVAPPDADSDNPSKLPPEHPDFEEEGYCPPKLLFPEAHKKAKRKRRGKSADDSHSSGSEDDNAATSSKEAEEPLATNGKVKGKGKAVTQVDEAKSADEESESSRTRKAKGRAAARKPAAKKAQRSS
ncbi:hypothetical protein NM688_g5089 [Phlebia brevispora]|uniref:Uncharacterized protein n=1 Tax=Phlebia brevispora TaxID=194682 RepID=A0ACC1T1N2_9APHY|nr:hypothetical protein NM688_g5089 [Phlebia brevispora]